MKDKKKNNFFKDLIIILSIGVALWGGTTLIAKHNEEKLASLIPERTATESDIAILSHTVDRTLGNHKFVIKNNSDERLIKVEISIIDGNNNIQKTSWTGSLLPGKTQEILEITLDTSAANYSVIISSAIFS